MWAATLSGRRRTVLIKLMMRCEQAQQLFDAYVDGELSVALATEVGAHRLKCPECRRALALLEVSGHIIASDGEQVALRGEFSERLLACVEAPIGHWRRRLRRGLYIGGPLAAAAVVALAFLGAFDRGNSPIRVAGGRETRVQRANGVEDRPLSSLSPRRIDEGDPKREGGARVSDERLEEWVERTRDNLDAKRQSSESLRKAFNLTILQLLDILEQAKETPSDADHLTAPDPAAPLPPPEADPTDCADVEDL
jgi:hypothetical protein